MTPTGALVRVGLTLPPRPAVTRVRRWAMRLSEAFEAFLRHLEYERQYAPGTIVAYRGDFYQYLAWLDRTLALERAQGVRPPVVRPNDLAHFTTARIRAWQSSLALERQLSPMAVRRKLHAFGSFARFLVKTGAVGASPMAGVTLPKKRRRRTPGMPLEAWRAVLALPLSPKEATIRGVFAWAGLRREEVRTLTVEALRLSEVRPVLCVRGKGDKERLVPVPAPLKELLVDYCLRTGRTGRRDPLFLTERGELYHPSMLTKMVRTWGRRVGTPMSPHKLRKSYATGLALAGVPPHLIQEYLGHESLATTQIYLESVQTPGIDAAIEAFARAGSVALEAPAPETHVNPENL